MNVSILILTLNEDINLVECIKSVSWSDDIIVFDSMSSDMTVEIAKKKGARVYQRDFDNWSTHQNWALEHINFKYPWTLYIDADERCTEELEKEIIDRICENKTGEVAFRVRRKDFFMGRWLKHAQLYPTWIIRLFRPKKIHYERLVNPFAIVDGQIGDLDGHLHHFPFSHGIAHWVNRHNKYSDLEAIENNKVVNTGGIQFQNSFQGTITSEGWRVKIYSFGCQPDHSLNLSITILSGWAFSMGSLD